jgi:hypothetical protein
MKRISIFALIIVIVFVVIAWSRSSPKSSSSTTSSTDKTTALAPALELAVGTLRLEGTSQDIDKELASELLPYWQLMDELNASESTAPQEITADLENIQGIMTADQVKAIEDMQLTKNDLVIASQVGGSAINTATANVINISQVTNGDGPAGGSIDGGVPPDGGGSGLTTGGSSQQSISGSQSIGTTNSTALIGDVIKLLEKRIKD